MSKKLICVMPRARVARVFTGGRNLALAKQLFFPTRMLRGPLSAKDLFVSQSALTGESLPVEKTDALPGARMQPPHRPNRVGQGAQTVNALDLPNICFMGTNVVSGTAKALVVATGDHTYFGALARHVVSRRVPTSFDRGVGGVSWLLIRFMLFMVPVVFLINGWTKHDWLAAYFFGLSVAVGLTPEMLPMIVTANLARGAVAMARRKVIVKRLSSMQNRDADAGSRRTPAPPWRGRAEDDEVFEYAFLNSYFQTGLNACSTAHARRC